MAKFEHTYCSQCGRAFGAGDAGFSHCRDHRPASVLRTLKQLSQRIAVRTIRITQHSEKLAPQVLAHEQEILADLHRQYNARHARLAQLGLTLAE